MDLINLELGKWLYLIIYLFFPAVTLLYLIRTFGLEQKEDTIETIQRRLEQANYWADIAAKMVQSETGTKSMASLAYTVQRNLDEAAQLLETAILTDSQRQTLTQAYHKAVNKLTLLQEPGKTTQTYSTLSLPQ